MDSLSINDNNFFVAITTFNIKIYIQQRRFALMAKTLFIKANNRPIEQSVSVKLYHAFIDRYKETHPSDEIIELDLYAEALPYYDNNNIMGNFKHNNKMELTKDEQQAYDNQHKYLDQFLEADKIVFGFPLWNKTVPAPLHTYFDYLNVAGKTFKYTAEGPVGLAVGKKVAILNARGGDFSTDEMASEEMAVNFVSKTMLSFGITDQIMVIAEGHNQYPDSAEEIVTEAISQAKLAAEQF